MSHFKHVDDHVAFRGVGTVCALLSSLPWGLGDCHISLFSDCTVPSLSLFNLCSELSSLPPVGLSSTGTSRSPAAQPARPRLHSETAGALTSVSNGRWAICSNAFHSRSLRTVFFYVLLDPPPAQPRPHTCVRAHRAHFKSALIQGRGNRHVSGSRRVDHPVLPAADGVPRRRGF